MKLKISDPNNSIELDFIKWIKDKIKDKILSDLNIKKLDIWTNYINEQQIYKSIYKKKVNCLDVILAGIYNLIYKYTFDGFVIMINPNINLPGFDRVKIASICKLINYGNQDISGYHIFTDIFEYFANNINEYLKIYLDEI